MHSNDDLDKDAKQPESIPPYGHPNDASADELVPGKAKPDQDVPGDEFMPPNSVQSDETQGRRSIFRNPFKNFGKRSSVGAISDTSSSGARFPMNIRQAWANARKSPKRAGLFVLACMTVLVASGAFLVAIWVRMQNLPDVSMLETHSPVEAIKIYDRNNNLAAVVAGEQDRQAVKLSQVSKDMQRAILAAEDHNFFEHDGVNPTSIMRALMVNLQAGRIVEGGSTITQQLVKNVYFPNEKRNIGRKIKELFLASEVDHRYSKERILEMYLNQVYFGNQAYGIERAAQRYFHKPASKLNLAESAFLAGLVKAPSALAKQGNRKAAFERQHEVLDKLLEYQMASAEEVTAAKKQQLKFRKYVSPYQKYPFYVSAVLDSLRSRFTEDEIARGMKVYTYLDQPAQIAAEKALERGIAKAPRGVSQGAIVSLNINDGGVLALVGGVGQFEKHQWNRATSPHTLGSSFKPFVYLTGFMNGMSPEDTVLDTPVTIPSGGHAYSPRNFDNSFMGPMTIRKALALSRNVCAVRVAHKVGIRSVIETAKQAGLDSRMDPYIPIALGACAASPLEMAGAYSTFARMGVALKPQIIRRVESNRGDLLAEFRSVPQKVFDSQSTAKLVDTMVTVVNNGTGILAKLPGRPVAGKTGTADQAKDIWFVGFTGDTCTAVWGGNDHNKAIGGTHVTGGLLMARIFKDYMDNYYKAHPTPVIAFMKPSDFKNTAIASAETDAKTGKKDKQKNDKQNNDQDASVDSGLANADSTKRREKRQIAYRERKQKEESQQTEPIEPVVDAPEENQSGGRREVEPEVIRIHVPANTNATIRLNEQAADGDSNPSAPTPRAAGAARPQPAAAPASPVIAAPTAPSAPAPAPAPAASMPAETPAE